MQVAWHDLETQRWVRAQGSSRFFGGGTQWLEEDGMTLKQDSEGWWFDPYKTTKEHDWYGPYRTKAEAKEAQASFDRCWVGKSERKKGKKTA